MGLRKSAVMHNTNYELVLGWVASKIKTKYTLGAALVVALSCNIPPDIFTTQHIARLHCKRININNIFSAQQIQIHWVALHCTAVLDQRAPPRREQNNLYLEYSTVE